MPASTSARLDEATESSQGIQIGPSSARHQGAMSTDKAQTACTPTTAVPSRTLDDEGPTIRPALRTPLAARQHLDNALRPSGPTQAGSSSPLLAQRDETNVRPSLSLSWKVPEIPKRPRVYTHRLSDSDDDDNDDDEQGQGARSQLRTSSQSILSGTNWRTPMKRKELEPQQQQEEIEGDTEALLQSDDAEPVLLEQDDVPTSPQPESDVHHLDATAPAPAWIPPRATFGLVPLDERLGRQFVPEDASARSASAENELGLARGGVVEIAGTPGSGKTALGIQLAIRERIASLVDEHRKLVEASDVQSEGSSFNSCADYDADKSLWDNCKAMAAHVIVIDTEGSLTAQRITGVAIGEIKATLQADGLPVATQDFLEGVLEGVHISRCVTLHAFLAFLELIAPLQNIPGKLPLADDASLNLPNGSTAPSPATSQNPRAKRAATDLDALRLAKMLPSHISLVVIDSISYFFRAPVVGHQTPARRERAMQLAFIRSFVARARRIQPGLRIAATNQMALTFVNPTNGQRLTLIDERSRGRLHPSLAFRAWVPEDVANEDSWQIILFRAASPSGERYAQIVARPRSLHGSSTSLRRREDEIRDVENHVQGADSKYWESRMPFAIDRETSLLRSC